MLLSDTPKTPDFVTDVNRRVAALYHEHLSRFVESLGATKDNASEFELRELSWDDMPDDLVRLQEVRRHDRLLGTVSVRVDQSDGVRYVVECQEFDHHEGCLCGDCHIDHVADQADAASY